MAVALPRRDEAARTRLAEVARRVEPLVLARDRTLALVGELGTQLGLVQLGSDGLQRGTTLTVTGAPGAGATSVALGLAAAATAAGEWAGAVDLNGTLGGEAAAAAGVALERFAVLRPPAGSRLPPGEWATVVATLLEGVAVVVAEVPRHVRAPDARRLVARARERQTVLVVLLADPGAVWPADAVRHLRATGGAWPGLVAGGGLLDARPVVVHVEDRATAAVALERAG
jgi:hypothetical protein